jgi:hypothetical protein
MYILREVLIKQTGDIMMMYLKKTLFYFLTAAFSVFFCAASFAATVSFSATQANPSKFSGFGAMVWNAESNANVVAIYQLPGFRFARINHEVRFPADTWQTDWANFPTNGQISDYQAYWTTYGDKGTDLSGIPQGYTSPASVEFLFLAKIPCPFIYSAGFGNGHCKDVQGDPDCSKGGCTLIDNNLQNIANYIAAGVKHFTDTYRALPSCPNCYSANYVELSNEPDGNWTVGLTTAEYTELVELVYAALQSLGAPYNQTKIAGAGVSHTDWGTSVDTYTNAILANSTALPSLGAFLVHQYVNATTGFNNNKQSVENIDPTGTSVNGYGQTAARYYFSNWYTKPKAQAPHLPVIVSEVGTKATKFHGITYNTPSGNYTCSDHTSNTCSIADTTSWGVRMYTYMISLLAAGANAPLYWQAHDQSWELPGGGAAMVNLAGNYRTNYTAMKPLFQYIYPNAVVLTNNSQAANDVYSVVFLNPVSNGQQCVTITLANGTGKVGNLARTTTVTGLPVTATLSSSTTTLFSQLGSTVYQGHLTSPDPRTTALSLRKGTLTHTTSLANDTAVTVNACFHS